MVMWLCIRNKMNDIVDRKKLKMGKYLDRLFWQMADGHEYAWLETKRQNTAITMTIITFP